jgi:hypothetical protein
MSVLCVKYGLYERDVLLILPLVTKLGQKMTRVHFLLSLTASDVFQPDLSTVLMY